MNRALIVNSEGVWCAGTRNLFNLDAAIQGGASVTKLIDTTGGTLLLLLCEDSPNDPDQPPAETPGQPAGPNRRSVASDGSADVDHGQTFTLILDNIGKTSISMPGKRLPAPGIIVTVTASIQVEITKGYLAQRIVRGNAIAIQCPNTATVCVNTTPSSPPSVSDPT